MSDRQPSKYCCVAALRWRMRLRKPAHPEAVPHDGGPLRRFRRCRRPFPLRPRLAQALRPEPSLAPLSAGKRLRKELIYNNATFSLPLSCHEYRSTIVPPDSTNSGAGGFSTEERSVGKKGVSTCRSRGSP